MKFLRLLMVPFAALVVLACRLGLPVRFGKIWSGRMGHMAGNMENYLCEREAGISVGWDFWYHEETPASEQLDKMLSRVVRIDRTGFIRTCALLNELFQGSEKHRIDTLQVDRDPLNLYEKQRPHLYFTEEEVIRGEAGLRELGIPEGSPWVYLIVRDSAKHPHLPYHSYRNVDIKTLSLAAEMLADRGYFVVRVGKNVLQPMDIKHPRIIDFSQTYDDFMSIYLGAKCAFCVSTGTGPDAIPVIFRRPVVYVNYVPVEYLQTYHRSSLAIFKHHEKDGKRMTLQEIYESGCGHFMEAQAFEQAGIKLVDNSPEEIASVVMEYVETLEHTKTMKEYWKGIYSYEDEDAQADFWNAFPRGVSAYNGRPLHGKINMRIGREFLKGYSSSKSC